MQKLIVVVNKMDELTVQWKKERYEHCVKKLTPFLKKCGFKVKKQVVFLPIFSMFTIQGMTTKLMLDMVVSKDS